MGAVPIPLVYYDCLLSRYERHIARNSTEFRLAVKPREVRYYKVGDKAVKRGSATVNSSDERE